MIDDLPLDDPSIALLDGELRAAIGEHWRRRSKSERQVGRAFEAMGQRLQRRATPVVLERLAIAATDEERHASLCVRLAEAYAGTSIEAPDVGESARRAQGRRRRRAPSESISLQATGASRAAIATVPTCSGTPSMKRAHLRWGASLGDRSAGASHP